MEINLIGNDLLDKEKSQIYELILRSAGGFGKFQILILSLSLVTSLLAASNHLSPIYLAYTPDFECIPRGSEDQFLKMNESFSSTCPSSGESIVDFCGKLFFDDSIMKRTIVTEFKLMCDRLPLLPTVSSSYMAGVVIFNSFAGFLSDRFGRRKIILAYSAIHILASFATAFSASSYFLFVSVRFFVGGSIHGVWSVMFVMLAEVTVSEKRGLSGGLNNSAWNFGAMILSLLSYLLADWTKLQLTFSCASLTLISFYFLVPESPLWLLQNGYHEEARKVLFNISKINGLRRQKMNEEENKTHQRSERMKERDFLRLMHKISKIIVACNLLQKF